MRRGIHVFFKILLVLMAFGAVAFGICVLCLAMTDPIEPPYRQYFYPILLAMYLSAVPFFTGLFYGYRFLCQTDSHTQETAAVVQTLRKIKLCAISYGILFLLVIPFWIGLPEADDAPGAMFFGLLPMILAALTCFWSSKRKHRLLKHHT